MIVANCSGMLFIKCIGFFLIIGLALGFQHFRVQISPNRYRLQAFPFGVNNNGGAAKDLSTFWKKVETKVGKSGLLLFNSKYRLYIVSQLAQ